MPVSQKKNTHAFSITFKVLLKQILKSFDYLPSLVAISVSECHTSRGVFGVCRETR